jgi:menaquinone-dependent protoporphyrinogen oxidase
MTAAAHGKRVATLCGRESIMCEVPVFYATTEGQTRRIAERFAARLHEHGLDSGAIAIASAEAGTIDWRQVRGACLAASLHRQHHQAEAVAFATRHHRELSDVPSLFISVSLSAASKNASEVQAAATLAQAFTVDTGWTPWKTATVAGRLAYTQYNWLVRWMMRRIARKEGASGDTSRDHEYTDWDEVARLADRLAYQVRRREYFPQAARLRTKAG